MGGFRSTIFVYMAAILLLAGGSLLPQTVCASDCASEYEQYSDPGGAAMVADLVIVRPLTFVVSLAGAAIWVVALPFTLLGGNTGEAGDVLVVDPLCYTFVRPLGYLGDDE